MDLVTMVERNRSMVLGAVLCFALLGACSSDKVKAPTDPEPIDPAETITESFSGEFSQGERTCHGFSLSVPGSITLELTKLEPLGSLTVGLGVGQPNATALDTCDLVAQDNTVRVGELFSSEGLPAGNFCVCVFDVGNIFPGVVIGYTVEATHP
jgi:hypothetical protein